MNDTHTAERPLVTFALFAYNQEQYVREAIEGAFAQTYQPLEIILSDDCSTDRTYEIMQEMAAAYDGPHELVVRRTPINLGLAGHINELLAAANGTIVTWIGGDDIALPRRTAVLVNEILQTPGCVAAHSAVVHIDVAGQELRVRASPRAKDGINIDRCVTRGVSIVTQSCAFRKEAFDHFGPFDRGLTHEGIVMAFRCAAVGQVRFIEEPLTNYRLGSGISTYVGDDLRRLKQSEPTKVSGWYMTAFRQIAIDMESANFQLNEGQERTFRANLKYFINLHRINSGNRALLAFIEIIKERPNDYRAVRAFIRKVSPIWMYRIFRKLRRISI